MTPIEKTVIVVDEQGHEYEATYPKRAKGLVKNGRARFIDDNKICLTCPPDTVQTEDITMSEHNQTIHIEEPEAPAATAKAPEPVQYSIEYVLTQLQIINRQSEALSNKIIELLQVTSDKNHNSYAYNNAKTLLEAIRCRETTNQQMLRIYEMLLSKLTLPADSQAEIEKWRALSGLAAIGNGKDGRDMLESITAIIENA